MSPVNPLIRRPSRIDLARTPTPIQRLNSFSAQYDVDLFVKRDDLTGISLSGNKIRKLEFVLADALARKTDTVLTCGGAQSNHCRATAAAAARLGLKCRLLLRTPDPSNPPAAEGNILLDRMAGAEIVWITPEEYQRRNQLFEREAAALQASGRKPYIVPEGASNALGAWGYIRAAEELAADISKLAGGADRPCTLVVAAGSGGTSAGLILGAKIFDLNVRVVSFNVCDDRDYFMKLIGGICARALADYHLEIDLLPERDIEIIDGYVGRGYALSRPQELELVCRVARTEGIFLDPVYTGKAFYGMTQELMRNPKCFGRRIIFIHTGGIFGLFPVFSQLAEAMQAQ